MRRYTAATVGSVLIGATSLVTGGTALADGDPAVPAPPPADSQRVAPDHSLVGPVNVNPNLSGLAENAAQNLGQNLSIHDTVHDLVKVGDVRPVEIAPSLVHADGQTGQSDTSSSATTLAAHTRNSPGRDAVATSAASAAASTGDNLATTVVSTVVDQVRTALGF